MKIMEAPPDLARLVAAHVASSGREWGLTLLCIYKWGVARKVRMYQTFTVEGEFFVTLSDSLPKVGRLGESNNSEERWR